MTFKRWTAVLPVAAFLSVLLLPRAAAAQVSSGPMTVQRIGNSAFIAPDFKITDFNGKACGLAGAYGGYLVENAFFIGAGGYWLTDTAPERDMWYFGLVTGVYLNRDRPVGFGFKALIGGGEATIGQQYTYRAAPARRTGCPRHRDGLLSHGHFRVRAGGQRRRASERAHEADGRRGLSPHRRSVLRLLRLLRLRQQSHQWRDW